MASEFPALLATVLDAALIIASAVTLLAAYRVIRGPTVPDRVVALDTIGTNVVAIAILFALTTDTGLFITVGLVLAIIGFISTITVARFITEGDIIQ
ncbi:MULTISPECIES: monovalent cation/H+ antiporter complex subunit F [unclassified Halorhabdus]|uniref:monovalent cation/H+ antiporter complex subunit F n=1 Tax=unclassified Halorhabdus TaxID=2621901 RepID=UPI0023DAF390|nr:MULTISPECIES: monovalent cation/H+ antiporter complex subunit F [unclassified Halorhabdus]WEL17206.1 Multisubunit Na /H antiporter, MnhF subunit [Halorhabdus sp. SVX81]WEL21088.1 Multisubunit Na /H antiporter, MnhF subunit [Halorhabdus sp. BNX81]